MRGTVPAGSRLGQDGAQRRGELISAVTLGQDALNAKNCFLANTPLKVPNDSYKKVQDLREVHEVHAFEWSNGDREVDVGFAQRPGQGLHAQDERVGSWYTRLEPLPSPRGDIFGIVCNNAKLHRIGASWIATI